MVKLFLDGEVYHTVGSSDRNDPYLRKNPQKTHPRQEITRENFARMAILARRLGIDQRDIMAVLQGKTPEEVYNLIFGTRLKPKMPSRRELLNMKAKMVLDFIDSF